MNILLLGLSALKDGFQELGHDVLTCDTDNTGYVWIHEFPVVIDRLLQQLPEGWAPELVLLTDESTHPLFLGLERLDVPVCWYAIDSHLHHSWHQAYAAVFDIIFVAQRDYTHSYVRDQSRQIASWLPLFCPHVPIFNDAVSRNYDLSFVGSLNPTLNPARYQFLEELQQAYPVNVMTGQYLSVFTQSKMILNQCVDNDVNFRTFEAMACGGLLVMEHVGNGLEDLFQDQSHCVLYEKGNVKEVVRIAQYYMSHREEREEIASRGRAEVLSKHTGVRRVEAIMEMVSSIDWRTVLQQRRARQGEIQYLLAPVYDYVASCYEHASQQSSPEHSVVRQRLDVAEKFRQASDRIHHELHM